MSGADSKARRPATARLRLNLGRLLERQARTRGEAPFVSRAETGPSLSYAAFDRPVNRPARGLHDLAVATGDPVVIMLPNGIEVIITHPAIEDCAVIGVPVALGDDAVEAFVPPRPRTTLDVDQPLDFCRAPTSRFMLPGQVVALDEVPRTRSGGAAKRRAGPDVRIWRALRARAPTTMIHRMAGPCERARTGMIRCTTA